MKAKKAREILTLVLAKHPVFLTQDEQVALKLGVAALARHINRDYLTYAGMHEPLEGETPPERGDS